MAVAGLQNASAFGPFFGESTTRASSVLQMWQELEGNHVSTSPSHGSRQQRNACNNISEDENLSVTSEQSSELGESERESVRKIFREWKENGASNCSSPKVFTESDSQMEQVIHVRRRPIRRLCGRQALVDLLSRAQRERKRELHHLSEQKPVSEFAHRNRIQALFRGRFLLNKRLSTDKRQSSVDAMELDFLRQRQTVTDLREEFLSKLDNSASTSSNNAERRENNEQEVPLSPNRDHRVTESWVQSHQDKEIEPEPYLPNGGADQEVSMEVESVPAGEEEILESLTSEQEESIDIEHADGRRNSEYMDNIDITRDSSLQTDHISGEIVRNREIEHLDSEIGIRESSLQEPIGIQYTEWSDHNREEDNFPRNLHEIFSNQWLHETPETTDAALAGHDDNAVQEPQEAIDSWLLMPSSLDAGVSLNRFHYDHFPGDADETTQTMEIRELSSRRRVSSLLRSSSFRESLNQVLQSHVERQVHFSSGNSALIGQDEEPLNGEQRLTTTSDDVEANHYNPSSTFVSEPNRPRNEVFLHANSHRTLGMELEIIVDELRIDMAMLHQRMNNMQKMLEACMDMEIELQRCIRQEVSAALNRTTSTTRDDKAAKDKVVDNKPQWEHVRKGICCLCAESKINTLLYRCGHICTCSECAVKLVRDNGKCPMCRAPVVEAVPTYFIQ